MAGRVIYDLHFKPTCRQDVVARELVVRVNGLEHEQRRLGPDELVVHGVRVPLGGYARVELTDTTEKGERLLPQTLDFVATPAIPPCGEVASAASLAFVG